MRVYSHQFTVEPVHERLFDICHLRGLRVAYPKYVFLLIPMCKWFPIDLKICMTLKCSRSSTFTIGIFSWTCVGGCKSMWKVRSYAIVASKCKASQSIMVSRFASLVYVGILPLFWMRATFCRLEMIWVEVRSKTKSWMVAPSRPLVTFLL